MFSYDRIMIIRIKIGVQEQGKDSGVRTPHKVCSDDPLRIRYGAPWIAERNSSQNFQLMYYDIQDFQA